MAYKDKGSYESSPPCNTRLLVSIEAGHLAFARNLLDAGASERNFSAVSSLLIVQKKIDSELIFQNVYLSPSQNPLLSTAGKTFQKARRYALYIWAGYGQ